jgi:hypothetical protein
MPTCVEAIQAAIKECGAKDLASLAALMGVAPRSVGRPVATGVSVPEGKLTRNLRWPGPFFLYDCEDPPGCSPQKCNTLTHCAELIWKVPRITTGHKTTVSAIEAEKHSNVSAIPEDLRGKKRPYLYKVYGPDKTSGWPGYGGSVNPDEVLAGKACPGEVSEKFRWTAADLDEFHNQYPDRTPKPITIRLISKEEGAKIRTGPTEVEREAKAKPKGEKQLTSNEYDTTIGGLKLHVKVRGKKETYYTQDNVEIPESVVTAMRAAAAAKIEAEKAEKEGKK